MFQDESEKHVQDVLLFSFVYGLSDTVAYSGNNHAVDGSDAPV